MKMNFLFFCMLWWAASSGHAQVATEVTIEIEGGALSGTLLVPESGKPMPVVLLIAGSGPTDRDGNQSGMMNNSLKLIAEGFAENGIASLRYDKRGIGKSVFQNMQEKDLLFDHFVEDAISCIGFLKSDTRFSNIVIAGHSEGSLIGMIASNREPVQGYISLAGAGQPADVLIRTQLQAQPSLIPPQAYEILDSLKAGKLYPNEVHPGLSSLFRPSIQPYMVSWFQYDPTLEIQKLSIPVMIVQGTTDIQVSMSDAEALKSACPKAIYKVFDGMNHVLKDAPAERQANMLTYINPRLPLSPTLVNEMVRFVKKIK
jgi:uncharacterized protein